MKWKEKTEPYHGERRTYQKFAWTPIKVGGYTVWLEAYRVTEEYVLSYSRWKIVSKEPLFYDY
jgi:hypothetical protein